MARPGVSRTGPGSRKSVGGKDQSSEEESSEGLSTLDKALLASDAARPMP